MKSLLIILLVVLFASPVFAIDKNRQDFRERIEAREQKRQAEEIIKNQREIIREQKRQQRSD